MRLLTTALAFCIAAGLNGVAVAKTNDAASSQTKQPWQWTAQERAAARRDPARRADRVGAYEREGRPSRAMTSSFASVADVIDGSRNPELYFPTELFEYLVRSAFITLPRVYPHVIQQRSSDLFRSQDEWDRFAGITAKYAEILKEETSAAQRQDAAAVAALGAEKCAAEAQALRAARHAFGRERFDRMLYEAVPQSMITTFSMDTDFDKAIGSAVQREERCQ